MSNTPIAFILGVGPGLGTAIANRFAAGGCDVAVLARRTEHLQAAEQAVRHSGRQALAVCGDVTDEHSLSQAFDTVRERLGKPTVLIYNAGRFKPAGVLEQSGEAFEQAWRSNCLGAFLAAQQALPDMLEAGHGSIMLTGATAALRGGARFSGLAVGKFGLRALAQSMAREFGPQGIHVAHVVVDGRIATPHNLENGVSQAFLSPDAIAESYWQLHCQHDSAWTLELDLRPAAEKF